MTKEDEITRNLTMIEYYKEQLGSIDMQVQYLQAAIADFQKGKITIEQLKTTSDTSEILIPVGGGAFLNGTISERNKVLVDIGAGYVMEKSVDGAVKKIEERIGILHQNQEKLIAMARQLEKEATELSQKTQQMMNENK